MPRSIPVNRISTALSPTPTSSRLTPSATPLSLTRAGNEPNGPLTRPSRSREAAPCEPHSDLHLVRRPDRPRVEPLQVDLVDLLGLQKLRHQEQGLRLPLEV